MTEPTTAGDAAYIKALMGQVIDQSRALDKFIWNQETAIVDAAARLEKDRDALTAEVERLKALESMLLGVEREWVKTWREAHEALGVDTSGEFDPDAIWGAITTLTRERDEARAEATQHSLDWQKLVTLIANTLVPELADADWQDLAEEFDPWHTLRSLQAAPAPEPEEPAPTEATQGGWQFKDVTFENNDRWGVGLPEEPAGEAGEEGTDDPGQGDSGTADQPIVDPSPAPATPTEPTVTTIDARSRIDIEVTGPCVVDRSPNSNVVTVYIRPGGKVTATPPDGLELYATLTPDDVVWDDPMNTVLGPTGTAWIDVGTEYLWTRDPSRIGDKNYEYPEGACVVTVRVVPEGEPWPGFPASPPFDSFDPGPAFLDPDAVYAFIQSDPEAWRQMTEVLNRPRNSTNWRQHQRANAGTPDAGLTPGGTGSQGWDLLGDVLCYGALKRGLAIGGESVESVRDVIRSKFRDNWLRTRPFGIIGKDWDEGTPFRRTWARTSYRSFADVLDEALALRFAFDDGTAAELLDAETLDMVLSDLRHFAAFVEADMAVSDPRMWRTSYVLAVECLRHLFPSLGLPDLSGLLTRWDGDVKNLANSVLTPEDPPRWLDKGDYTAHHMMGVCYSVYLWVVEQSRILNVPAHVFVALRIWTGIDGDWMWAKKTGTPQDGQDHRCARFTNSLTELWFPTNRDAVSLGSQDHALFVVAGCRVAS